MDLISSDEEIKQPTKKVCSNCIIHCSDEASDSLVTLKSLDSWQTLRRAAEIRQHGPVLSIAEPLKEGEVPNVQYHRKCRSIFTMKKTLDSILSKQDGSEPTEVSLRRSSRHLPSTSTIHDKVCIFCGKSSKYLKRQNTREHLIQCTELSTDHKIRDAASRKQDDRILVLMSKDLVAAKGHYHKSCYKHYTKEVFTDISSEAKEQHELNEYEEAEMQAYNELFLYIRNSFIPNPEILPLTYFTSLLEKSMNNHGITQIQSSTKKHIHRKLERELGKSLNLIHDDTGRVLIYPDSLSMEILVRETYKTKQILEDTTKANSEELLNKAALELRRIMKNQDYSGKWPPDTEQFVIPEIVTQFICTLLSGECSAPSDRISRLVTSISSDIVYAVTCGKTKPPKHILLPFAVKCLTGNTELIKILNRLGHSISYSQMEEIDTALCIQKLEQSKDGIPLPENISPGVFTCLAWDNIDRLEETLTGGGTSHRVNGIVIQPKLEVAHPKANTPAVMKSKKRSINPPPLILPLYNAGQRAGPPKIMTIDTDSSTVTNDARLKNYVWILTRMLNTENQTISSWTGFNIKTRCDSTVTQDTIGYLPTISAPATDMSTVNEILEQTLTIMHSLQLQKIVVVFDQALYAKAAEIIWKQSKFNNIIIRMGVFHTVNDFLSIIGKRFQDAGLRDLCVESGILAEGSVTGVMEGRKYNRAIRVHKLVYEALMRLAWQQFLPWVKTNHPEEAQHVEWASQNISIFHSNISEKSFQEILQNRSCVRTFQLFQNYLESLRSQESLSSFWVSYIDMIEILLNLIRASREGNWMLHLAAIRNIIPWCFAYDKINYARFLTYYYATMSRLATDHPDVYAYFMQGGFSVQVGAYNTFGRIPVDQAMEETANKDTQTPGGTKGFSLKVETVARYYLTSEYRSKYLSQLRRMINSTDTFDHPDLHLPRIRRDETDIQSLIQVMESSWLDPFQSNNEELVSISTAVAPPPDVARELFQAKAIGEEAYKKFKQERLESDAPATKFFDSIVKKKLRTFSDMTKKPHLKSNNKEVIIKSDKKLFAQMILVAESRKLQMKQVLAHPLGPIPWSLANGDGSLRKTNKASLARELEKKVSPAEIILEPSVTIIDGMSIVNKIKGNENTFLDVAESVLNYVLHEGFRSQRIDVVFDVYKEASIKGIERINRGAESGIQYKNLAPGQNIQHWKKFLASPSSKTNLIKFLVQEWKKQEQRNKLGSKILYVTCEDLCFKISQENWCEIVELESSHEEADTRLLLHALHAAESGYKSVIITADDTDVLVLCLGLSNNIPCPIYQKCGTKNRIRYLDITKLRHALGGDTCEALIGMHAFTGCDTVSAFAGRGKLTTLKKMVSDETYQQAFNSLGTSWEVSQELFQQIQAITCRMYLSSTNTTEVNKLRYQLFCAKRGEIESSQLPPCEDCLFMHTLRANYQAAIWRRSLQNKPIVPECIGLGWTIDEDGKLSVDWMRGSPAPDAVLQMLSCKCVRSCKLPDCTCLSNGLKCTDMCRLHTCTNQAREEDSEVTLIDCSDDDDYDDDEEDHNNNEI